MLSGLLYRNEWSSISGILIIDILDLATTAFSSTDFVIPIALIGEAALSVLKQMTASTPSSIATVKTFLYR